jgi:TolA-binding protein
MLRLKISSACALFVLCAGLSFSAQAQSSTTRPEASTVADTSGNVAPTSTDIEEVRRELHEQQEELKRMREVINQQSQVIDTLRQKVENAPQIGEARIIKTGDIPVSDTTAMQQTPTAKAQASDTDSRLARVEEQTKKTGETLSKQLGSITFSGDIRLRYESFYGQLNALSNAVNPAIIGNELSSRQRFRVRARLKLQGQFGKDFDWGIRLASGSFADAISTNQTFTDFYNRKAFGLDQAFIAWTPERVPGLRIQGGKFDIPWTRTEMTLDNDLQVEGFSESYSRGFGKNSALKNLTFIAWQLPMFERNSAFVRNANGTVNIDQTARGGRDLALFGAQVRTRIEPSSKVALSFVASDLYFAGTQFITPAQTITTQVSIPRDLLVAGAGNLGISTATNNAVNRDGRLASGFNLVDLIGRVDLTHKARYPVSLILDFVVNTQTHDVSVDVPGGGVAFLPNHEDKGYYGEIQVGRAKERGDMQFDYTFIRLEKDAVLTPFNFSDFTQQSDTRVHRLQFNYTADPHVVLSIISIINQRANGLLGVFGNTPAGSLNRPTTRLQFDTTFRF